MKFNWSRFTETDYNNYIKKWMENKDDVDVIGAVHVGDICIEVINEIIFKNNNEIEGILLYNFYVAHEDTGYGYKNDVLPYDYADGDGMDIPYDLSYDKFKAKAEKLFKEYIEAYKGSYSLVEHANRPLEMW